MVQSIECPHCKRVCGSTAGLAAHVRSMHPEKIAFVPATADPPRAAGSNGMEWGSPPAPRSNRSCVHEFTEIVIELRRRPGEWARVFTYRKKNDAHARAQVLRKHEPYSDIEWAPRSLPDGTSGLWARFVGEGTPAGE